MGIVRPRGVSSSTSSGPGPVAPDGEHLLIPFSFSTSSPLQLITLLVDDAMIELELVLETPFNDPAATLQVGTPTAPGLVLASADSVAGMAGNYGTDGNVRATVQTTLQLTITPGASTAGSGYVQLVARRA